MIDFQKSLDRMNILALCEFSEEDAEHIKTVFTALEKQIPLRPMSNCFPWAICPACGGSVFLEKVQEHIHNAEKTYCEHCGQALKWGEGETE